MSFFKKNFKLPNLSNLPNLENIENYAKKFINTIDEQAKNIVNEIKIEENKSKKKKEQALEEQYPYPWSDEIDEETVKNAIVALSMDNRNFLIAPGNEDNFNFDFNENLHYALNLLKFDKRLETLRYNIVPKQIKEDEFWKNYFYRIHLIKSGQDIKTLPDIFLPEEIPKAEEPEELKKKQTEELFSTDAFDDEEELLKDFEKEISDVINIEEEKTTSANEDDKKAEENADINDLDKDSLLGMDVKDDIDSLDNISESDAIKNDTTTAAAATSAANDVPAKEAVNVDYESEDDSSIDETMKELEDTLKKTTA